MTSSSRGRLFNNIDYFQTPLTFNEVRTSTIEIQVNTRKYVIKQHEVFICELNCTVQRDLRGGMREPISAGGAVAWRDG